jgi:hypothetical protein
LARPGVGGGGTAINASLKTIRSNDPKFARWGDDRYRHIGGLSQALFDDDGSSPVPEKYRSWVETLFVERKLPQLRRDTTLILIPWSERSVAPNGQPAVLQNAEDELIQLAATDFLDLLLNVKGEGQVVADGTSLASLSVTGITRRRTLVTDARQLAGAVSLIERCPVIGLDVETEIPSQHLCLVQIAIESETFLIDALRVPDLAPLRAVFGNRNITKVIHNAPFERRIFGSVGLELNGVFDTLVASRSLRGHTSNGGHSLAAVCHRELGLTLSKDLQRSDWQCRPLTASQLEYAALDAEVLLAIHDTFAACLPLGLPIGE